MKVYRGLDSFSSLQNTVITNGTFDGVHLGHQQVLASITEYAKKHSLTSVVITFWPHPRLVLQKDAKLQLITTIEERIHLFEKTGIDTLVIIPFTKEFGELTADEYVEEVLIKKLDPKKIVVGYDHKFGKNREGNFNYLEKAGKTHNFDVEEIKKFTLDQISISSTKIRDALGHGDISQVTQYLGSPYTLSGKVVEGNQLGRKIGFRTANILLESTHKIIPASGVYAVKVIHDRQLFDGMLNIGIRPTIDSEKKLSIEVHLFDFDKDIYGKNLTIQFIDRIRDEKKFDSLDELKNQLTLDQEKALQILDTQNA